MARDKALLPAPNSDLLLWQWQLRTLEDLQPEEIFWSGPPRPGLPNHLQIIPDAVENAGPLAGISACLTRLTSDLLIVLAIDLPRMNAPFLKSLLELCSPKRGAIAQNDNFFEPLAAIYPKALAQLTKQHLQQGHYSMQDLIRDAVEKDLILSCSLRPSDVPLFKNFNTPVDFED